MKNLRGPKISFKTQQKYQHLKPAYTKDFDIFKVKTVYYKPQVENRFEKSSSGFRRTKSTMLHKTHLFCFLLISFNFSSLEDLPDLNTLLEWISGLETSSETGRDSESGRDFEDSPPIKTFLETFATVLTGVANTLETAHRFEQNKNIFKLF